ncbi:GTPase Era, mitochondrial-like isoform X2 [Littorina saxatilis]|uniref:GTPase Era, mitochondrial-like isoform X2 n=1 Tax=Littorina saxatilis TaxID=31220 RepID=UPI0038B547D4
MFATKFLRSYGLKWCQAKRVFKQAATLQACQHGRPSLTLARLLCTHTSSNAAQPVDPPSSAAEAEGAEQERELKQKGIGRFQDEQRFKLLLKPDQPADARILRAAVIGLPNSGKSTLTNNILGWRVSSVSQKVHTTRKNTTGIFTEGSTQIVFLDTPGILHPASRKRHNLENSMLIDPERSLHDADLVCVLVDVSNKWTRNEIDPLILQVLHLHQDIPAVLILNKVDLLQSREMLLQITRTLTRGIVDGHPVGISTKKMAKKSLDLESLFDAMETKHQHHTPNPEDPDFVHSQQSETEDSSSSPSPSQQADTEAWTAYFQKMRHARRAVDGMRGWPHFKRVFMVSALSGNGVPDVKDHLLQSAKPGDWDYHSSLVTSQDPRELVIMCVREKLLEHLRQEVPYKLKLDFEMWEVDEDGMFNIIMNVFTQNRREVSILLGPKGQTIQKIASEAKQEMMNAFRCEMRLKLIAKVARKSRR